ncbi:Protein of unknown function [Flavobacterium fluvii]|uniref:DUF2971 domain-containing protein n=1 Tax=Flavobacterium fluvii TaxID=468056 RepID=A0A1M5E2T9_9FLAO|nr:DUF2971 domain-containing protein [Flavobacterium fluvii]SHF73391.1 Protein of unknown function [Flavobacterium fluvii]
MSIISSTTFFRFRTYSPISLKELQYGEIFFVDKDQLNDPYDTKNSSFFEGDFERYKNLTKRILSQNFGVLNLSHINVDLIVNFLASEKLFYDQLIEKIDSKDFKDIVLDTIRITESIAISESFIKKLKHFIFKYAGGHCYIASFSKGCDDPIMWSHYANYHTGFCLIFDFENNKIQRNNLLKKHLDSEYELKEVKYKKECIKTNGFYTMPSLLGETTTKEEESKHWEQKQNSFLIKYKSWKYEKEYRIIHYDLLTDSITESGPAKRLVGNRTFYYDQKQLTGIIFGSKMKSENRKELEYCISTTRYKLLETTPYLPLFIFYESNEKKTAEYMMDVIPLYGFDMFNRYFDINELEAKEDELEKIKNQSLRNLSIS